MTDLRDHEVASRVFPLHSRPHRIPNLAVVTLRIQSAEAPHGAEIRRARGVRGVGRRL